MRDPWSTDARDCPNRKDGRVCKEARPSDLLRIEEKDSGVRPWSA